MAILALCAALFHPSPAKVAASTPTLAPPPDAIASASPVIRLPPEALCPMCHSSARVQTVRPIMGSCVIHPLETYAKEREDALRQGMHVEYGQGVFGRDPRYYCNSCRCHFNWTKILTELEDPIEVAPTQNCSQCDSDARWAEIERSHKKLMQKMEEQSAANDRALEASRRNDTNFKKMN